MKPSGILLIASLAAGSAMGATYYADFGQTTATSGHININSSSYTVTGGVATATQASADNVVSVTNTAGLSNFFPATVASGTSPALWTNTTVALPMGINTATSLDSTMAVASSSLLSVTLNTTSTNSFTCYILTSAGSFSYDAPTGARETMQFASATTNTGWTTVAASPQQFTDTSLRLIKVDLTPTAANPSFSLRIFADKDFGAGTVKLCSMMITENQAAIPEPTTATLSLLGLAALAFRRKRA